LLEGARAKKSANTHKGMEFAGSMKPSTKARSTEDGTMFNEKLVGTTKYDHFFTIVETEENVLKFRSRFHSFQEQHRTKCRIGSHPPVMFAMYEGLDQRDRPLVLCCGPMSSQDHGSSPWGNASSGFPWT
jgi:hypothetical protein